MTNPKISIITVTFNSEQFLEETISSVINQNYDNLEYIIIDGGSTDSTLEIIEKYEDHITYWASEDDRGIYDAINKGILVSKGDYIGIINSDDWYELGVLKSLVKSINDNQPDIIHGILRLWENDKLMGLQGYTSNFLNYGMISHPTCFVKREVYNSIGLFNTKYVIAADYDFMLNCFNRNVKFFYVEQVIANFRLSGISNSNSSLRESETSQVLFSHKRISLIKHFFNLVKYLIKR
jgi:glycosyltransferase involved in cell wall biosynthesis